MGLGGVISNLLSLGAKLLPTVSASAQAPPSSSSPSVDQNHQMEAELRKLMRMLEHINATLYDAEQREITDSSVKLWLKELKRVAYDAEDVFGEYHYEVLRAEVEERNASPPESRKHKLIQVPYGMLDKIQQIRSTFDEISKDRIALQLSERDGPKHCNNELQIAPTSHFVVGSNIFGRATEKEKLINLLSSESDVISVVTVVGMGGIGKTTVAQLAYNDQRIQQRFDIFGWIYVSGDFNVKRLTRELAESITRKECSLTNLSVLQEKIRKEISGKRVLLVLDDVWNEKKSLWDTFQAPLMSARFAKIVVTTRNDLVAQIMQTMPTFDLDSLSVEACWQLFEHYAFGGVEQNKNPNLVEIGKQIMNKCGMLPLAVKSIASLLRHEGEEESWREILESELWESHVSNEIFRPLQISYERLPTYLKPCFLYCSMFPKGFYYNVEYMVKLWMSQGLIKSSGNKTREKIGFEYAQQLCQRSLFEREGRKEDNDFVLQEFKLHDLVHDLARLNSEKGSYCYSTENSKLQIFPNEMSHLYIVNSENIMSRIFSGKFTALRTLIAYTLVENIFTTFDLSMVPNLRVLEISGFQACISEFLSTIGNLKHLRYLSLSGLLFEMLPECICSLYTLQNLILKGIDDLKELPTKIGNLISLEELIIDGCSNLEVLPESICKLKALRKLFIHSCFKIKELPNNIGNLVSLEELQIVCCFCLQVLPASLCKLKALRKLCFIVCPKIKELPTGMGRLTNLQTLEIGHTSVSYLHPSLSKFVKIHALKVMLNCEAIRWLKDFPDLGGTLCLHGLKNIPDLLDVQCANIVSMRNLEHLILSWDSYEHWVIDGCKVLVLSINSSQNIILEDQICYSVMVSLQPHHNLSKLTIKGYRDITFPEWIGSLCKLRYLKITCCYNLQFLEAKLLPLELEELYIYGCPQLQSMPGIQKLNSLVKLSIGFCQNLFFLIMEPPLELTMCKWESSYGSSSLGSTNLASLKSLQISNCCNLLVVVDEFLPVEPCNIEVSDCPGLREWCLQRGINYTDENERRESGRRQI